MNAIFWGLFWELFEVVEIDYILSMRRVQDQGMNN